MPSPMFPTNHILALLLLNIVGFPSILADSKFVNISQITQGVSLCCPSPWAKCCRRQLLRDEAITGCLPKLSSSEALSMAICLGRHFYGNRSEIAKRQHECCWLLNGEECKRNCYTNLRAPTIPPETRWGMTDACAGNGTNNANKTTSRTNMDISKMDCVLDNQVVLHSCFNQCIHWYWNGSRSAQEYYRPSVECENYRRLKASDSCLVPLHILEQTERQQNNGTGGE